jgi:thioredoxin reductase (NADPH)
MYDNEVYDLTIIGAGPTGLFSAFYAGLREMKTKIVEALPEPGGQLTILYPEKFIYDVPGFPKILAKDLVPLLVEQTALFSPTFVYEEEITTLERKTVNGEEVWRLGREGKAEHLTRTVLITAGIGAFAPNKLPNCPSVDEYEGRGVYYFVKDKRPFRGKRMLIVGGGDTAIDWCINLKDWASHITLIHRRDEFRAHEASLAAVRSSGIPMKTFFELKEVRGNGAVQEATIFNNKTGEEEEIDIDIVLLSLGFKADIGPLKDWGLDQSDARHIRVDGFMETNLPGVFAAGDIAAVEGSEPLNLIVTGFAQGAIAANAAKRYVDPKSRLFPGHSSELKL